MDVAAEVEQTCSATSVSSSSYAASRSGLCPAAASRIEATRPSAVPDIFTSYG